MEAGADCSAVLKDVLALNIVSLAVMHAQLYYCTLLVLLTFYYGLWCFQLRPTGGVCLFVGYFCLFGCSESSAIAMWRDAPPPRCHLILNGEICTTV